MQEPTNIPEQLSTAFAQACSNSSDFSAVYNRIFIELPVTPTFYYLFITFLTSYISVPSFMYNLC